MLAGIPQILVSGLVQEGTKMVPVIIWWWRRDRNLTPKMGLAIGAIAGAGFGIFEAVWVHNWLFASGWNLDTIFGNGFLGIAGFWERFFITGFHIAATSLAGYGLAKGKGWQFYLLAAAAHFILNYSVLFVSKGYFNIPQSETWIAGIAMLVTIAVILLRWRQDEQENEAADVPAEPAGEDI
jgi:RsiW-degrading membrane proteinase PrsW (M82 family)